jgi:hypothetical protein
MHPEAGSTAPHQCDQAGSRYKQHFFSLAATCQPAWRPASCWAQPIVRACQSWRCSRPSWRTAAGRQPCSAPWPAQQASRSRHLTSPPRYLAWACPSWFTMVRNLGSQEATTKRARASKGLKDVGQAQKQATLRSKPATAVPFEILIRGSGNFPARMVVAESHVES